MNKENIIKYLNSIANRVGDKITEYDWRECMELLKEIEAFTPLKETEFPKHGQVVNARFYDGHVEKLISVNIHGATWFQRIGHTGAVDGVEGIQLTEDTKELQMGSFYK